MRIGRVEYLMRIALDLAGVGNGMPLVKFDGLPPAGPGALPEILAVKLTDLLAARASNHLPAALDGDRRPSALLRAGGRADTQTEDIRRHLA